MLGSPLRCAQSSDSAGLSPQGFLSFLGFEERNLRVQHPQLLEGHCKGHREGTKGRIQWGKHGKCASSLGGHCHLAGEGWLVRQCWGIPVGIPLLSSPYFEQYLSCHPLVVQIFNAFFKHCATKHLPKLLCCCNPRFTVNLYEISVKKSVIQRDFYCYQVSKC